MSKPVTTAPRRFAVAIACRPATPAPSTRTLRGRDGAGGGGHHREEAPRLAGGEQRRRVAGDVGLRGERVHRLGAGDPRDRLHREARHAGRGERPVGIGRGQRREVADQDLALVAGGRSPRCVGTATWSDDVGAPGDPPILGPGVRVLGVGVARGLARRRPRRSTSSPCPPASETTSGISATRRSPCGGLFRDPDLHLSKSPAEPQADRHGCAARSRRVRRARAAPASSASRSIVCRRSTGIEVDRRADQPVDPRRVELLDPLGDLVLGADQRGRVDELVGDRLVGLLALAVEVERLHLVGDLAEAEAVGEVDVEVRLLGCPCRRGRAAGPP